MNDLLQRLVPALIPVAGGVVMTGLVGLLVAGAFVPFGPAGSVLAVAAAAAISLVALALPGALTGGRSLGFLALGTGAVVLLLATAFFTMDAVASRRSVERYRRPPLIEKAEEEVPLPTEEGAGPAGAMPAVEAVGGTRAVSPPPEAARGTALSAPES